MIPIRHSSAVEKNKAVREVPPKPGEKNLAWLKRNKARNGIILLGGSAVTDFRIRVAQSHLRSDLLPSHWSLAGILLGSGRFVSVPLELRGEASLVPGTNGIETCKTADYDDPECFPNIAFLRFTADTEALSGNIDRLKSQRSIVDLPGLMFPWLGFMWGAGDCGNPLLAGKGLPSAVFVETVFGMAGIELTPGLSSTSSCPEAIWQSAKWWHPYYEQTKDVAKERDTRAVVPSGSYAIRQPEAAAKEHEKKSVGRKVRRQIGPKSRVGG